MKMWSEGLGKIQLEVDFARYWVDNEESGTVIKGVTVQPVQWDFKATFTNKDIPGLLNIFFKPTTWFFILRNIHMVFVFLFEKAFKRDRYAVEVKAK
ncbi:MAG: hypothetical protein R6U50_07125 [Desulfobacterales bacterium]